MSIFANKKHNNENAYVKVLGTGCPKCRALAENAEQALAQVGREPIVEHIEDVKKIAAYGVMSTPCISHRQRSRR
ncbi:thioredoxin family protein [Candidatus Methanomassiliicoccus intestinalis]|uniref:thioredoxin family protein n=1 Tax=Candidatus Methanomassiliicoccus intestinalis TaxID=1406512 RepID=UPI0037DCD76B